jgi:hypothetical protein
MPLITGSAHPPGVEDKTSLIMSKGEIESFSKKMNGIPIYLDHTYNGEPLGKVVKGWVDDSGRLMVTFDIPRSNIKNCEIIRDIKAKKLTSLSLGMNHLFDPNTNKISFREINEISITDDPALPDTQLKSIEADPPDFVMYRTVFSKIHDDNEIKSDYYKSNIKVYNKLLSMAENTAPIQTPVKTDIHAPVDDRAQQDLYSKVKEGFEKNNDIKQKIDQLNQVSASDDELRAFAQTKLNKYVKKFESNKEALYDFIAKICKENGKDPNSELIDMLKEHGKNFLTEPLVKFITLSSNTYSAQKTKTAQQEEELQKLRKENEELRSNKRPAPAPLVEDSAKRMRPPTATFEKMWEPAKRNEQTTKPSEPFRFTLNDKLMDLLSGRVKTVPKLVTAPVGFSGTDVDD